MISLKPEKGRLLIAEPSIIGDISFNRAVILLVEETETGFVGFIMNKPLEYSLGDLIPEINAGLKVYNGGPVEQENLYFIHRIPHLIPGSFEIADGIYWGGDFHILKNLLERQQLKETDIRFFLGYSGWDADQLEQELEAGSWIVAENTSKNSIIANPLNTFWKEKMIEFGGDYLIWSNAPENPNYN